MKKKFFAIRNQADSSTLELYFLDVIADTYDWWTESATSKVQEIIDKVNYYQPSKIKCTIDSVGGDAYVGLAIYNYLKNVSAKVEVEIIGLAGSIASVIAMAANKGKLRIAKNAFMMIHKAEGATGGTADQIRQAALVVEKFDEQIADIYSQRTGKAADEIKSLYANGDYWMTGEEAVAQGFADEIFNETINLQVAARLDNYDQLPDAVKAKLNPVQVDNKTFIEQKFEDMKNYFTEVVNKIKGIKPAGGDTSITNQIAEAIQEPFERLGDEIETTISNKVNDVVKTDSFTTLIDNAVKTAVENQTKELNKKVSDLEQKNTELETEITNKLGGASTPQGGSDTPAPIGKFN